MRLETERLIIREYTLDDLYAFAHLMADPEVMRFSINGPLTREQAQDNLQNKILKHYEHYQYGLYAVINKLDNCMIGYVGLINQTIDGETKPELGYRLLPEYWGEGLATEAALAITQYGFNKLQLKDIISIIDPKNQRSIDVAKRLGMTFWRNYMFYSIPVDIYILKKV